MPQPGARSTTEPAWEGRELLSQAWRRWLRCPSSLKDRRHVGSWPPGPAQSRGHLPRGDPGDGTERAINWESLGWCLRFLFQVAVSPWVSHFPFLDLGFLTPWPQTGFWGAIRFPEGVPGLSLEVGVQPGEVLGPKASFSQSSFAFVR